MHSAFHSCYMKTDGEKGIKERNDPFMWLCFPNPTPKQRQGDSILLLFGVTEREGDYYVECVTVQHIECTDSVQCATELY